MKSILTLILLISSVSAFADTYETTKSTIKYDRESNGFIIGESQRVTDDKGSVHNRGIGTYIPLDQILNDPRNQQKRDR